MIRQFFIRAWDSSCYGRTEVPVGSDSLVCFRGLRAGHWSSFLLGSFFLLSSGNGTYGNQAGPVGLVLMVLGGATALASILARRSNPVSSASTQSRIH